MKKRNFFCNSVIALSAILGLTLSAQVKLVNGPIPLDGGYSEGVWKWTCTSLKTLFSSSSALPSLKET